MAAARQGPRPAPQPASSEPLAVRATACLQDLCLCQGAPRCHKKSGRPGLRPWALQPADPHFFVASFCSTSSGTDFGRSMGRPIALAQTIWDTTPMARETAKTTV